MIFENHNPLEGKQFQIMNKDGEIVSNDYPITLENDKLIEMYKTMLKSRVADTKALQYQRQGRMLTYAPNLGQEATQVGTIAATEKTDWMASAFRELGSWLYRDAPLYNIFLYWYGNEEGMKMPDDIKILPISVPIASQFQHATGLAYASKYRGEKDISIAYVGDGGTSQGDFHEALNFAALNQLPVVFIIQNNQYAISMSRQKQTSSRTLAQKAIAYDMPGIQVDGNDIFAVYEATKEAVDRARSGNGPSLIECYTYRLGAHTTADDPTKYRDDAEVEEWKLKDPIDRLYKYLLANKLWTKEDDEAFRTDYEKVVKETFEKVENSGLVPLEDVFKYHYEKMTPELKAQYEDRKRYYEMEGK
ncbi:MAG: pyruvate dehydrogenase (acetyl-transferring) E1 component subunit alpha [Acidaminobacteraceae bacterium]